MKCQGVSPLHSGRETKTPPSLNNIQDQYLRWRSFLASLLFIAAEDADVAAAQIHGSIIQRQHTQLCDNIQDSKYGAAIGARRTSLACLWLAWASLESEKGLLRHPPRRTYSNIHSCQINTALDHAHQLLLCSIE